MKNPAAVALGRLGGAVGGRRRAEALDDDRKKEIAQQGAKARWAKWREAKARALPPEGSSRSDG